jgi:DNA polymerase-3 subunit alpha
VKEVKITNIDFLHDIRNKLLESLTLVLPLEQINDNLVNTLHELATNEKGSATLMFEVADVADKYKVDLFSSGYKIDVNNTWLNTLDTLGVRYKIN